MVTCLPTRASVLGVTNPRGAFNPAAAHTGAATNLSAPLLSRFDVVLVLTDAHEPTWDAIVSGHVLSNHQQVRRRAVPRQPWAVVPCSGVLSGYPGQPRGLTGCLPCCCAPAGRC